MSKKKRLIEIGGIKILKMGQSKAELPLQRGELRSGRLPDDCGSLGSDLDYYAGLSKLGIVEAHEILRRFNDLAADSNRRIRFEDQDGFGTSLHRDRSDVNTYYDDAMSVIESGGLPPEPRGWEFSFAPSLDAPPIRFRFGRPDGKEMPRFGAQPPRRMVVLVGANGVGKTHLLASLARLAYAPPGERDELANEGRFVGSPAFPGILAVAYSAFDTFLPPKLRGDDLEEVAQQLETGTGRYVYCGMRDVAAMIRSPNAAQRLLDQRALERLFVDRVERIQTNGRMGLFAAAMEPVLKEASMEHRLPPKEAEDDRNLTNANFAEEDQDDLNGYSDSTKEEVERVKRFLGDNPAAAFHPLSSGHKIVLLILANMAASLHRRGLALIDEPETHLHPPLLAALMTGIRRLLDRLQAYAIVATHSPVVAQETLSSQVIIVEGHGITRQPEAQTFGENVGALTREIFGLHTGATDYRNVLDKMLRQHREVSALENAIGEPLSSQALAYVMSALRKKS